jgi:hypothetical protein
VRAGKPGAAFLPSSDVDGDRCREHVHDLLAGPVKRRRRHAQPALENVHKDAAIREMHAPDDIQSEEA